MSTTTKKSSNIVRSIVRWVIRIFLVGLAVITVLIVGLLLFFRVQAGLRETKTRQEMAPQSGQFVRAGDVEIFVQESVPTTGPVIVFIHGTGAWSEIWREPMETLTQAGFRTIAIDLPPFGFSERPANATYGRNDQARRIIGVLDALHISKATLVGHSFGAGPTVEATLLAPDRVEALVLVDAALGLDSTGTQENTPSPVLTALLATRPIRNAIVAATITNPRLSKRLLQLLILDPADATEAQVQMLQQQLVLKDSTNTMGDWLLNFLTAQETSLSTNVTAYQTLNIPVLIIWGDADTIVPLSQGEYLNSLIPRSELVVLKHVNHIPHIEETEQFNSTLLSFLARQQFSP